MKGSCDVATPKKRKSESNEQCSPPAEKKRRSTRKLTPTKGASKNSTPKKNATPKSGSVRSPDASPWKIDLRMEAKLSAEEDSRVYAGRRIHPFFSLWKEERKIEEQERSLLAAKRKEGGYISGPIHVFENVQEDASPLDWSGWRFLDKTTTADFDPESSNLSVMDGSVESLNLDNLPSALRSSSASISQNVMCCPSQPSIHPDSMLEISPPNLDVLANEQAICPSKSGDAKLDLDLVVNENTFSGQKGVFRKSDTEPLSKFLQESMRPYYHSCKDKIEGSLWIHKYKPTKPFEVCGNEKTINFLCDWLHLWHERRSQRRKGSSNRDRSNRQGDDDDNYICSDNDYDSEHINEKDSLQNVLLLTGPNGSGKSAAVYACAQEQGFKVLEVNPSDCQKGTPVKQQNFGLTVESHRHRKFKRSLDFTESSPKKTEKLLPGPALPNGIAAEEMDDGAIELITISDDEDVDVKHGKSNVFACGSVQTLILVKDVDSLFPEDRRRNAAMQHISRTAKGPIILTSNSNNGGLPNSFARLHVSLSSPLPDELLCHMYMVCVTEEVNINPLLLKKFIQSSDEDIRKTIMQLQFWFQSEKYRKDRKVQKVYGLLPFDLEACHHIIPKILPWSYPSELSKLIEKEVAKSITIMEENSSLLGLDINERKNDLDVQCMKTDCLDAEVERIKRSLTDSSRFESQHSAISELSNCSGSLVTSPWQKGQSKLIVMSSDSEKMDPNNGHSLDIHKEIYKRHSPESNSTSFCKLVFSGLKDSEEEQCKHLETAYDACLNETSKSFDISCFPGSISIPETEIPNGINPMSGPVSSGCQAGPVDVSLNNELTQFTLSIYQSLDKLPQNSDSLANTEIPESSSKEPVQIFRDGTETTKLVESSPSTAMDMVQNLWRNLRIGRKNLGQHANPEQLGAAIQVAKLTSGLTNLISEADLLFLNHQLNKFGIMEPPMSLSDEATYHWYDEQMMMSTVALHGFGFYAKRISEVGSKFGCKNDVDLTSEMLACTTNAMALGKLSRQDQTKSTSIYAENQLEVENPTNDTKRTSLSNMIRSIIPARSSLAMKGLTFNEYISSLRQISISEAYRISHGCGKMSKRRRVAPHYLSKGKKNSLSPEDISLVCEGDLFRTISSQYTANMESNCS